MNDHRIRTCTTCPAKIIFLVNPKTDKSVPVDADTVLPDDKEYVTGRHVSHFKTCNAPSHHSRKP